MSKSFGRVHLKQSTQIDFQIFLAAPTKLGPSGDTVFDFQIRKVLYSCHKQQLKVEVKTTKLFFYNTFVQTSFGVPSKFYTACIIFGIFSSYTTLDFP